MQTYIYRNKFKRCLGRKAASLRAPSAAPCPWLTRGTLELAHRKLLSGSVESAWKKDPGNSFPFCGAQYITLHCPGHETSGNSYLGIGRGKPPAGHLSCGNKQKRKSGSSVDHGVLGLASLLSPRKQILLCFPVLTTPHSLRCTLLAGPAPLGLPHYVKRGCTLVSF